MRDKILKLKNKFQTQIDAHALYIRSIIARYEDDYELEKNIVDQAIALYPENVYFQERVRWHALPYFEKYEARKTPPLPDDYVPVAQEYRDQLTIVVAGDANIFEMVYECIESIKNTKYYNNVKIVVYGREPFSSDQYQRLSEAFGPIEFFNSMDVIRKYVPDIDAILENPLYRCCEAKWGHTCESCYRRYIGQLGLTFINDIITTSYFITISADMFLQDEQGLDKFLSATVSHGVAVRKHPDLPNLSALFGTQMLQKAHLLNSNLSSFLRYPWLVVSFYGARKNDPVIIRWIELIVLAMQSKDPFFLELNKYYTEEWPFSVAFYEKQPPSEHNVFEHYYVAWLFAHQNSVDENNYIYYKNHRCYFLEHSAASKDRWYNVHVEKRGENRKVVRSLRYRDLPWRDKPSLEQIIKNEEVKNV